MFTAISILLTFVDVWLAVIAICNLVFNKLSRKHTQFSTINFSMHKVYIHTYVAVSPCPASGTDTGVWCNTSVIAVTAWANSYLYGTKDYQY